MYKNCREELLAVMRAFVIETGENGFSRVEAIATMCRSDSKYPEGTVSAHLTIGVVLVFLLDVINPCMMIMKRLVMGNIKL